MLSSGSVAELPAYFERLSNSEFRTATFLLADVLLPLLDDKTYWEAFTALVPSNTKAFLGAFLKAAGAQQREGRFQLSRDALTQFARQATSIDCKKILEAFLPNTTSLDDLHFLLANFCEDTPQARAAFLLASDQPVCYYELFQQMKRLEGQPADIRRYCILLMRKSTKRSFNMAAMLKEYFALEELPGTFSLRIEAYQLSRLEVSFDAFCKVLNH